MITVLLNRPEFEYDIHSLVKAFFPEETVYVADREKKHTDEVIRYHMDVSFLEHEITMQFAPVPQDGAQGPSDADHPEVIKTETAVDYRDPKETKNRLKRVLYRMLSEYTGKTLPWGDLTGIRPTKLSMTMLEEGRGPEEIVRHMQDTYLCSPEKARLSLEIAQRELALLRQLDYENGYSLYIGIPFCPTTCLYCSFTSFSLAAWEGRVDEYLDALEQEIDFTAASCRHKKLNTIYIGGGTPTTLSPGQLDRLMRKIKCSFDLSHLLEFTVEAGRPDSITEEKLKVLLRHGVDRISINPQTMKQKTLDLIGRRHTVDQTIESFQMARRLGFDNINMDLIVGLPGEELSDVAQTLEEIRRLSPDNLTVHSLALKRAARLNMYSDDYKDFKIINTEEHVALAARAAQEMGMAPYYLYRQKNMAGNLENVGYAREGKAGIYNVLIMEEKQTILALGAGAISKFVYEENGERKIVRVENVKDIRHYFCRMNEMIARKAKKMEEISWH